MNSGAWRIFYASVVTNAPFVAAYALLDALFVAASSIFSFVIAIYFGLDVFGLRGQIIGMLDELSLIAMASALAAVALLVRVLHGALEAKVTADRELWLARRIREDAKRLDLNLNKAARASNHYGRLSACSMKACSVIPILVCSLIALPFIVSVWWGAAVLASFLFVGATLGILMQFISARMQHSSSGMIEHGKAFAIWKISPEEIEGDEVGRYSAAYFRRIFLASIFGYTPLVFATLFSFALLSINAFGIRIALGEAFVGFVLIQIYLSLLGRMLTNIVKSAAFIPALSSFSAVILSAATEAEGKACPNKRRAAVSK